MVIVKTEETLAMVQNVAVPYIKAQKSKDENLHDFKIVNTEWVPENMVLGKPVISKPQEWRPNIS